MKNLNYLLLILVFSSCQKILHEPDYAISKITSSGEMNVAVNGLYARLSLYMNNSDDERADDYASKGGFSDANWPALYNIVISANSIIAQFENKKGIIAGLKPGIGEAYLIRAYAYFRLVRNFGQVPVVKDVNVNYTMPKSSFHDIYAFIEADLLKAISFLPSSMALSRIPYETPCRGSAKVLLAEVYLTMGGYPLNDNSKYLKAAQIAGEVKDSAYYYGFGLTPDYAYLWDNIHTRTNENVFTLFYTQQGVKLDYNTLNSETHFYMGTIAWMQNFLSQMPYGYHFVHWFTPCWTFFKNYPNSYRKEVTFQTIVPKTIIWYTSWQPDMQNPGKYYGLIRFKKISTNDSASVIDNVFYKKYGYSFNVTDTPFTVTLAIDSTTGNVDTSSINFKKYFNSGANQPIRIFRYAHTLLTYAEAKARSGQLDASAYEAVNMVRRRANKVDINSPSKYDLQPGLSATQFADSVIWERAWEFCAEPELPLVRFGPAGNGGTVASIERFSSASPDVYQVKLFFAHPK